MKGPEQDNTLGLLVGEGNYHLYPYRQGEGTIPGTRERAMWDPVPTPARAMTSS